MCNPTTDGANLSTRHDPASNNGTSMTATSYDPKQARCSGNIWSYEVGGHGDHGGEERHLAKCDQEEHMTSDRLDSGRDGVQPKRGYLSCRGDRMSCEEPGVGSGADPTREASGASRSVP